MASAPTQEQQNIIDGTMDMVSGVGHVDGALKALAGAGSGKTTTLISTARAVRDKYPNAKILYLAYNREIMLEASAKFGELADSCTMHSMAIREVKLSATGRKPGNVHGGQLREILGNHCSDYDISLVTAGLRNFCTSADNWPDARHIPERHAGKVVSKDRREKLVGLLEQLLLELFPENKSSKYPCPHDLYLKYWQMTGSPGLDRYDLVMLDEAQDANPVILGSLEGAGRSIYVGDSHQAIYQWRNAVDALKQVGGTSFPMTQSFRFGPVVAEVANEILSYKHDKPVHQIKGFDRLTTHLGIVNRNEQHARIYRTNRTLIQEALVLHDRAIPFAIAGNNDDLSSMLESLHALKRGDIRAVRHPTVRWLKTWDRAQEEAEKGGDSKDVAQAIKIVEEFDGRVDEIIGILQNNKDEKRARVIMTTAHRSKGREWANVVIAPDFDKVLERAREMRHMWDPEMNLMYVAATRAMSCLEVRCEWLRRLLNLPADR